MATVPGQPDVVYATTLRDDGIFKGTRGGADWEFLEIEGLYGRGSVVAVDPFTPTRVYAASSAPSHLGTGWWVHISEDGGETWPTYTFASAPEVYSDCNNVGPLVVQPDPAHPGHMLAGVGYTRFGDPIFNAGGIYRSTDHGRSWTDIDVDVGEHISEVLDIAYDRELATVVYAATGRAGTVTGSGMLRSTDGGQSWQPTGEGIAALDAVWSLAVEPRAPYRVFAMTFDDGVYLSEDQGLTWKQATPSLHSEQILCTDEAPPVLYAATGGGLLRSANGAESWTRAAGLLGQVPVYSLATVRDGDRVFLYAGTTGGYVEGEMSGRLSQVNASGTLVNAGVYRYTTLRGWRVYLPLVVRQR
jgi:hypothetical protein